jgi:hypothetical protein
MKEGNHIFALTTGLLTFYGGVEQSDPFIHGEMKWW